MNFKNKLIKSIKENKNQLRIDEFINFTLFEKNAYYIEKKPIGKKKDYITSPEISQMFGEIIGLYILNYWENNINSEFNLIEFGPGNGTLLNDILRTTKLNTNFINLANILLIEINRKLTKIQKKTIKVFKPKSIKWTTKFLSNSKLPNIIYMNEFFDCLPIRQFYKNKIWYEKVIVYKKDDKIFSIKNKKVEKKILIDYLDNYEKEGLVEISFERIKLFNKLCKHIKENKGLLIIIDYGYHSPIKNFTLQTISNHKKSHIFDNIGNQDITSYVNFRELIDISKQYNLKLNYSSQKEFLMSNGIKERKSILTKNIQNYEKVLIEKAFNKLVSFREMGNDFKFLILSS